jgi:hypothetical protein
MGVVFQEYNGTWVGIGEHGRRWRVIQTVAGWRLELRDPGSPVATYAGTHPTLEAAMDEATSCREPQRRPGITTLSIETTPTSA